MDTKPAIVAEFSVKSNWRIECRDKNGKLRWAEDLPNIVMTVGKNDLLTQYFKGSGYSAAWYVGLVDNAGFSAYAAADTMSSHAGWAESVVYSNATRPAWSGGTAVAGAIDNSATPVTFAINVGGVIRGAFLASASNKGGTTGIIYCGVDFSAPRTVLIGDVIVATVQLVLN